MKSYDGLPLEIDGGKWNGGHVQGIALDTAGKYVYYAFTTVLVKTDLEGNLIGTVTGLLGHLGCIDFNDEDGRLYGSLELKHDSIGQGIMKRTGQTIAEEDAFYIAIFDVDKIDRVGMDAERDGVMTAVYLGEVVEDYNATDVCGKAHRYGCSGIDGTGFGPIPGAPAGSPNRLFVAYGIYGEIDRTDNDYQVLLCFDWRCFGEYARPLVQGEPHHSGPRAENRYFLYTGNTTWGVQNLEYDPSTGDWCVAVYVGKKPQFPNYPMYIIDGHKPPREEELRGRDGERGLVLSLKKEGACHEESGICGLTFKLGQTGIHAFDNGLFYISHNGRTPEPERLHTCVVRLYRRLPGDAVGFERVTAEENSSDGDATPDIGAAGDNALPPQPNYISAPRRKTPDKAAPTETPEAESGAVPDEASEAKTDGLPSMPPSEPDDTPVLEIRQLSKSFGDKKILEDISLTVHRGEIFGFLGPNGSGKTTTIKLMLGLLSIDAGEISICGHNVRTDFEAAMACVGGIIENPEMYKYLTGRQNLEQYCRMYGDIPCERVDLVTRLVGLGDRIDDKLSKYSLGMRQRLGLAQALLNHPSLLVLDEPTNGLDPAGIHDLRDTLTSLAENGVSVFVSSHQLSELEQMCTHVGVLDCGRLLGVYTMEELHSAGAHDSATLSLRVENGAAAEAVMTRLGLEFGADGDVYSLTLPETRVSELLREIAVNAGLLAAVPVQRSLEQAFLEMTRSGRGVAGEEEARK